MRARLAWTAALAALASAAVALAPAPAGAQGFLAKLVTRNLSLDATNLPVARGVEKRSVTETTTKGVVYEGDFKGTFRKTTSGRLMQVVAAVLGLTAFTKGHYVVRWDQVVPAAPAPSAECQAIQRRQEELKVQLASEQDPQRAAALQKEFNEKTAEYERKCTGAAAKRESMTRKGTAVITFSDKRAGKVCMTFSDAVGRGSSDLDKVKDGRFTVVGGTKAGAKLHATARFTGREASVRSRSGSVRLDLAGRSRGLSASCRAVARLG